MYYNITCDMFCDMIPGMNIVPHISKTHNVNFIYSPIKKLRAIEFERSL